MSVLADDLVQRVEEVMKEAELEVVRPRFAADDLFDDALEGEAYRQACDLLQGGEQVAVGAEQLVYLLARRQQVA